MNHRAKALLVIVTWLTLVSHGIAGTVLEESFESASLARYSSRGSEVRYTIYLPDNYAGAEQSFPSPLFPDTLVMSSY